MYVIIAGAGKVGWNLARELIGRDREVTLIESDHARYRVVELADQETPANEPTGPGNGRQETAAVARSPAWHSGA